VTWPLVALVLGLATLVALYLTVRPYLAAIKSYRDAVEDLGKRYADTDLKVKQLYEHAIAQQRTARRSL
jgi:hypothetical protein